MDFGTVLFALGILVAMVAAYRWKWVGIGIGTALSLASTLTIVQDLQVRTDFLDGLGVFLGIVGMIGAAVFVALGFLGDYVRARRVTAVAI
jgi:hypothetical protein